VQDELLELITDIGLNQHQARAIYESGYTNVWLVSKAKPINIMKALQKTLVVKRQYSDNLEEIFLKQSSFEHATLAKSQAIVNNAKALIKQ